MKNKDQITITPAAAAVRPLPARLPEQAGHTPAPWIATVYRYPDGLYQGRPYIYSSTHGHIAETFMSEDGEANARLIAASPALLEALKRLVNCPDLNLDAQEDETFAAIAQARAAIALAEGKA